MKYSQGICGDGAAILQDGLPLTPERIIEALNRSEEWQPIETAPKDGTNILLVNRAKNIAAGMWLWDGWTLRGGNKPDSFFNNHFGPTHWMPLPKPPSA